MTTIQTERPQTVYALGHTPEEYERLRAQARAWETATGRLLGQIGLGPDASCLDAGCGPGETMRLMAERVGPAGRVLGVDADAALRAMTLAMLHGAGHRHFQAQDLAAGEPIPGAPFDLVYARLLLFHLPRRVEVLARLWDAVAPGGHLLVQDYDLRSISTLVECPVIRPDGSSVFVGVAQVADHVVRGPVGAARRDSPVIGIKSLEDRGEPLPLLAEHVQQVPLLMIPAPASSHSGVNSQG